MGRIIKVEKEMLKISAEEHERKLRENKTSAMLLEQRDRELEKTLKKLKKEK